MSTLSILLWFGVFILHILVVLRPSSAIPVEDKYDVSTLVLLHVLFRHGDRTPDANEVYPTDPYRNQTYELGYGELTNNGKNLEYFIGKALRKKYNDFLGVYTSRSLLATTTDYNRTKASCELVLAGAYPPNELQQWNKEGLNWQPIPYTYQEYSKDHILGDPLNNCPKYQEYYNNYLGSPAGLAIKNENRELYEYLSKHTGWNIVIPHQVYNLYFALKSEENMGLSLPLWTNTVWPTNITEAAIEEYYVFTATTHMRRLSGGFFLKKILDDTTSKINESPSLKDRKVFFYSAHENNIAYLLILLDVFYPHVPPFGAYITLEVHKINNVHGIKIFYQDYSSEQEPRLLKLPGCDNFCPIEKFTRLVEEYLPASSDVC